MLNIRRFPSHFETQVCVSVFGVCCVLAWPPTADYHSPLKAAKTATAFQNGKKVKPERNAEMRERLWLKGVLRSIARRIKTLSLISQSFLRTSSCFYRSSMHPQQKTTTTKPKPRNRPPRWVMQWKNGVSAWSWSRKEPTHLWIQVCRDWEMRQIRK